DDVIRPGAGQSRVEAGAGDDRIEFAAEAGVASAVGIELGAGRDRVLVVARAYYTDPERWENWSEPSSSPPPPENWHAIGRLVVHDLARGEDTLSGITDGYGRTISFAELDRNGDGRIDAADPGVELDDGALLIDLAEVVKASFGLTEVQGPSTLRLLDISALDVGDFADHPSAGADELTGSSGNDLIHGLDGGDQITGGRGDDRLFGDAGDDLLHGEDGADTLDGGTGNDTLQGDAGADRLVGGAGDDVLVAEGSDVLEGGAGDDVARIRSIRGAQDVAITLGAGTDTFELRGEPGGGEDLTFPGFGSLAVRDFTHGEDLFGRISLANHVPLGLAELDNNGDGVIDGRDRGVELQDDGLLIDIAALARFHQADQFDPLGPSTLLLEGVQELTVDDFMRRPTEGADEIVATTAADTLRLGDGDDVVRGAEGSDVLMGEAGNDWLFGEAGNDVLAGGAGDDLLSGGSGANRLMGGDGSDFLEGSGQPGASGDFMAGGAGNDRIQGSRGNDVIQGGDGDDALAGRRGSNQVWGGAGDDLIEIGMDDRIHAGTGDDVVQVASRPSYEHFRRSEITLGSGQDRFEMTGDADRSYGRGFHTLLDFRSGEDLLGELGFGAGRTIGFAELDGNGDGVVDRRDQGVGYSQGGLLIDLLQVAEQVHGPFTMGGPSALRLVGVDALRPDDFVQG
ncbi:calcium-binding protein, partial [Geminicoccus harenae]